MEGTSEQTFSADCKVSAKPAQSLFLNPGRRIIQEACLLTKHLLFLHPNSPRQQHRPPAADPSGEAKRGLFGTSTRSARLRKRRSDCLQPTTRLQHFKNAANHFVLSSASLVSKQAAQVKASRSWHRSLRNESELARERGEDLIMLVLPGTHTHKSLR